jgi:hypothetical protein
MHHPTHECKLKHMAVCSIFVECTLCIWQNYPSQYGILFLVEWYCLCTIDAGAQGRFPLFSCS